MLGEIISDADANLMEAIGQVNTIRFIIKALENKTRGAEVDDALYCMVLAADSAAALLNTARGRLEDVENLPVDKSNNGEN